jgi:O-antigen ligase
LLENIDLKKYINVEIIISVLFPFLILFTYIGRGIYNSTLFVILCFSIYLIYKNEYYDIFKERFISILGFFLVCVAITVPFSDNLILSLSKYSSFIFANISVVIAGFYLYTYSKRKKQNLIFALYILFFSSVCMEIITITSIYFDINVLVFIKTFGEIKTKVANGFHLMEIFTSAIIPLSLFLYYLKPSNIKLVLIITSFVGVLASTSRTAMLATLISCTLFVLVKNRGNIFTKEFIFFILSIFLAFFIAFKISPQIQERVKTFQTTFALNGGDKMSGRYIVYKESFNRFKTAIFMGHGLKNSTENKIVIKNQFGDELVKHPHNIYLELLLDTGLLGFLSFLLFVGYLLKSFYTKFRKLDSIYKATALATLVSIFLSSLSSWSIWSSNHIGAILAITLIVYNIDKIKLEVL